MKTWKSCNNHFDATCFRETVDKTRSLEYEEDGGEQRPCCKGQISPAE